MAENPLRKNQAVNFSLPGEQRLLHFLADWIESELSKVFRLVVITPGNGTPNVVQVIPRGESAAEDATYLHMIDRSLENGYLRDWKIHAEFLPRIEVGAGNREYATDFKPKQLDHAK